MCCGCPVGLPAVLSHIQEQCMQACGSSELLTSVMMFEKTELYWSHSIIISVLIMNYPQVRQSKSVSSLRKAASIICSFLNLALSKASEHKLLILLGMP